MSSKLVESAERLMRGKRSDVDEPDWDVRITYESGSTEWFIFEKKNAKDVPAVIALVQQELVDPESRVRKLVISSVGRQRNG